MRWLLSVSIVLALMVFFPPKAHAIIFLPALILIPIAKIVALIIGGFSVPAVGIGALWSRLFKKSLKRTLGVILLLLLFLALVLIILLKLHNPERPLF